MCLLIPERLIGMFSENVSTINAGGTALRIICAGFVVSAVSVTASGALEGLGKGTPSLLISLLRYVVVHGYSQNFVVSDLLVCGMRSG